MGKYLRGGLLSTFCLPFVYVDKGGGVEMSTLVHSSGEGVKVGSNFVHVLVEWPLT